MSTQSPDLAEELDRLIEQPETEPSDHEEESFEDPEQLRTYGEGVSSIIEESGASAIKQQRELLTDVAGSSRLDQETLKKYAQDYKLGPKLAPITGSMNLLTDAAKKQVMKIASSIEDTLPSNTAETKPVEAEAVTPEQAATPDQPVSPEQRASIFEQFGAIRGALLEKITDRKTISLALDLVPVVGGLKMTGESLVGWTMAGEKLSGKERVVHAGIGMGSLLLDLTVAGVGESEVLKISGRSIELVEGLGKVLARRGLTKQAEMAATTMEFMAKHPKYVEKLEKVAQNRIDAGINKVRSRPKQALQDHEQSLLDPDDSQGENQVEGAPDNQNL